jgi:hypothetical protein
MTRDRGAAVLAARAAAAAILIGVELAAGAIGFGGGTVADPCAQRAPFRGGGVDGVVQQVVLGGLDGAACRLHTTREELVLSLAPGSDVSLGRSRAEVAAAIRAGVLRSLDDSVRRGDVPAFLAPVLRQAVRRIPIDRLLKGGLSLSDLLG